MNTNDTINAAHSAAIRMLESNSFISAEDTVCAIRTKSGVIFTGASRSGRNTPNGIGVHAEVEAVQEMLASGENVIEEIVLIGIQSRMQMLPCNNCIGYILSLSPANAGCMILMPDRAINITEVGRFAFYGGAPDPNVFGGGAPQYGNMPMGGAAYHAAPAMTQELPPAYEDSDSITATSDNSSNDFLKNKVSSLLSVADDDEEEEQPVKKKRFGLFRK